MISTPDLIPLTEVVRSGRVESLHLGAAVVCSPSGEIVASAGSGELSTYLRSAAKPVQLLAMLEGGLERGRSLSNEEVAIATASHGGEEGHVHVVRSLLEGSGLSEELLRCGADAPLEETAAAALLRAGRTPLAVHNNCSGKHAAMLVTSRANGWQLEGYLDPDHPLQRRIVGRIAELAGRDPGIGVDGCGAPTFYLPLAAAATMIARFMEKAEVEADAARVVGAMVSCPWHTSASSRLAFRLMEAVPGVLGKEGAEGLFVVGVPRRRSRFGKPVAMALKVVDGAGQGARGREPAVASALLSLGIASAAEASRLRRLAEVPLYNAAGREVGAVRGVLTLQAT